MTYRLRLVDHTEPDIADTLVELDRVVFNGTAPTLRPYLDGQGWWWLVYHDGMPVAYCGLVPSLQHPTGGYLARSGVLKEHRGRGLQRRMLRARERHARRLGMTVLVTDTNLNTASANNLIRCGYLTHDPVRTWSFASAIYWIKHL